MDLPKKNVIFHSYVILPEGTYWLGHGGADPSNNRQTKGFVGHVWLTHNVDAFEVSTKVWRCFEYIQKKKHRQVTTADPFLWHEQTMGWLLLVARWRWTMHDVTTGCSGWVSMIYLIRSVLHILEETLMIRLVASWVPMIKHRFMSELVTFVSRTDFNHPNLQQSGTRDPGSRQLLSLSSESNWVSNWSGAHSAIHSDVLDKSPCVDDLWPFLSYKYWNNPNYRMYNPIYNQLDDFQMKPTLSSEISSHVWFTKGYLSHTNLCERTAMRCRKAINLYHAKSTGSSALSWLSLHTSFLRLNNDPLEI
jgi:hypothetical protein